MEKVQSQLYGRVTKRNHCWHMREVLPEDMWGTLMPAERGFCCLMRLKLSFLDIRPDAMFTVSQTAHDHKHTSHTTGLLNLQKKKKGLVGL